MSAPSRASPFNIVAESLRLDDFSADQIAELYGRHTQATGQEFTKDALDRVFELTQGQPWLVNALAYEITVRMGVADAITAGQVEEAKERLIRERATHLDSLVARLHEPRVKRVLEPVVAGVFPHVEPGFSDDLSYVRDLGLIRQRPPLEVANPIYREVVLRVLGDPSEQYVMADPHSFVLPDGRFDLPRLLEEFVVFWREHGEVLIRQEGYPRPPARSSSWPSCTAWSTAAATSTGSTPPAPNDWTCSSAGPTPAPKANGAFSERPWN